MCVGTCVPACVYGCVYVNVSECMSDSNACLCVRMCVYLYYIFSVIIINTYDMALFRRVLSRLQVPCSGPHTLFHYSSVPG